MLLSLCRFALNSTHSASTKKSLAFVDFGREPNLPLGIAVCDVTDSWVLAGVDYITSM